MFRFDVSGQIGTASISAAAEVNQGECLLVTGPSGAGKTTLLRMLAGLHPISSGDVSLGDETWNGPAHVTPTEVRSIGFVFQDSALFPRMSVTENVQFGLADDSNRGAVLDLISKLGLEDRASAKASTLSGGEQQRVAVARAIARKPKLLLLDEPFAALDDETAGQTADVITSAIAQLSIPAVVVAHAPTPVLPIASVALRLEQGIQGRAIPSAEAFL